MAIRKNVKPKPNLKRDSNAKRKSSKRRKVTRKKKSKRISQIKMIGIAAIIGGLSALGFWRCLDDDASSPLDPLGDGEGLNNVDVGEGRTVDPTLLSEEKLLEAEMPEKGEDPSEEIEQEISDEDEKRELEARFPNYAVAFHFHTQVRAEPSSDARVIAYARRGNTFRVSERLAETGCSKGWYEIEPGGLFICSGEGVIVSDKHVAFAPSPPPPKLDASMPYSYAYVTSDNVPQYWRVPTAAEVVHVTDLFARIEARDQAANSDGRFDGDASTGEVANIPSPVTGEHGDGNDRMALSDGGVDDPYALPPFVYLRMAKGFFVSTDDETTSDDITYRRTVRGRYVPTNRLTRAKVSTFEGLLLGSDVTLPQVYVTGGGVKILRQEEEGGPLKVGERRARLSRLPFLGMMKRRGRNYVRVGEKDFLSSRIAAVLKKADPPKDIKPAERWIDIDLEEQTLVAYEGDIPVFATLVSTGREDFETPRGSFRIYSKHIAITMDDPDAEEEAYSIEDVPWTQYFEESYALHGAFWHNRFGRVRSHGCVNLSPADARRLFFWTGPHLPDGLHGIVATRENKGTRVVIH
jgi:hypothetical protein